MLNLSINPTSPQKKDRVKKVDKVPWSPQLKIIESDISLLHIDIKTIKEDIFFIKEYIIQKKIKEDARWF